MTTELCQTPYGSSSDFESLVEEAGIDDTNQQSPPIKYRCLIHRIRDRIESKTPFFSIEFFPPKTDSGVASLFRICDRMAMASPLFADITWKTGANNSSDDVTSSLSIASSMLNYAGLDTMLHLTCVGLSRKNVKEILDRAKANGVKNILALRGDLPRSVTEWQVVNDGFNHAIDLVRFIRQTYADYFVICVAGYPTGHPDAPSFEADLKFLKEKVDAGADFIITQLFFDTETYLNFVSECRSIGIVCPILPGILPVQQYQSLSNIAKLSKLEIPRDLWAKIEAVKENDEAVRKFGIDYGTQMCQQLLKAGVVGLHFYTLNREFATIQILKNLGLWNENPRRTLPWRTSAKHDRCMESVRPIFWNARPQSYIYRTSQWEEFPNGRWGNSASASFRDLEDYYLFYVKPKLSKEECLNMWGHELASYEDIFHVFASYIAKKTNKYGYPVSSLPWNETGLSEETLLLQQELEDINLRGVLTINSQPQINQAPSTDPVHGWGNPGGYVYQKAYLEFFSSKENVEKLKIILQKYPYVNYHIANHNGEIDESNCSSTEPSALTWGVFPGMEIVQPTVYDPIAFKTWKKEAFGLWMTEWGSLYSSDSPSYHIIETLHNTYCLVNLIDNNFVEPSCLFKIVQQMIA